MLNNTRFTFAFLGLLLVFSACNKFDRNEAPFAGGTLTMCLDNEPITMLSAECGDYYSQAVLYQVQEGLVGFDPVSNAIIPKLAASWEISKDGLSYQFKLRNDVYFHEHELLTGDDEKFQPLDVVKTFEWVCTPNEKGEKKIGFTTFCSGIIKGADEFFEKKAETISGLVLNGNDLTIELVERDENFLNKLANIQASIVSHVLIEKNKVSDVIGTGPFRLADISAGEWSQYNFVKNLGYYGKDEKGYSLPYLDSLVLRVENKKLEQLDLFEERKIDLILGLPTSRITKMLEGRFEDFISKPPLMVMYKNPTLKSNYMFFNTMDPRLKDKRVRLAINMAINRDKIGSEVLRNQYDELGIYGIVPPVQKDFRGYDFEQIRKLGFEFNPEKAKKLLAEAGYPNGEGFGTLNLRYAIGDINSALADDVATQLRSVLGINVNIDGSDFDYLSRDAAMGNGEIFRLSWAADYPSPETFLDNFYGKHVPEDSLKPSLINGSRYRNPAFDSLFEKAKKSTKLADRMKWYCEAEKELMKDPPFIPLWYSGDMQIVYSNVRNLNFNSMSIFDFTKVYKKDWTEEEYLNSIQAKK